MSALRLYVLRHGEPVCRQMFYGHRDVELSARGIEQAKAQARALERVDVAAVHSSDLQRATFGAQLIADARGLTVDVDVGLREMHLGRLEGVAHADAVVQHQTLAARSYRDMLDFRMPEGGESVRDVMGRVIPRIEAMVETHRVAVLGGERRSVVLYAHNTVNRVVLARAAGAGPEGYARFAQRYGSLSRIDFDLSVIAMPQRSLADPWRAATIAFCNLDPRTLP